MDEQIEEVDGKLRYIPVTDRASLEGFGRKYFLSPLSHKVAVAEQQMIIKPNLNNLQEIDMMLDEASRSRPFSVGDRGGGPLCNGNARDTSRERLPHSGS